MTRILIIGSGIAGLFAASQLAKAGMNVVIITKKRTKDSSTNWAQGGIAAILDSTEGEAIESHIQDTLLAGDGLCNEAIVRDIVLEAGDRIRDLIQLGVEFELDVSGQYSLAQEGGHSQRRILHAKDATGRVIERALVAFAEEHPLIELRTNTLAIDLIQRVHRSPEQGVAGVWCLDQMTHEVMTIEGDAVLIATGGVGQLWSATTNPDVATGDGIAMAYRAGACIEDMAFIQFHPTALFSEDNRPFLISEALRGAGAVLMEPSSYESYVSDVLQARQHGLPQPKIEDYSFMNDISPMGSLATRDIVARAIDSTLKRKGMPYVYLCTSHLDTEKLKNQFPTIQHRLDEEGIQLGRDPIPVVPAAHYMVGGIKVDRNGCVMLNNQRGIMPHLYAIGESACTGMHGANRLASNSLLEAVVFAHRVAQSLIHNPPEPYMGDQPAWRAEGLATYPEHGPLDHDRLSLVTTMTREVGIVRSNHRLARAKRRIQLLQDEVSRIWNSSLPSREIIELRNLTLVGKCVVEDAISRSENRGLHYNLDLVKDDTPE